MVPKLRALTTPAPERDTDKANDLLEDRRRDRLNRQLINPDSRVLEDLLRRQAGTLPPGRTYVLADIDSKDHGWLTIEVEPNDLEEVRLSRYDRARRTVDVWMSFDILSDYGPAHRDAVLDGFAVDPDSLDDDEVTGIALGLPARPIVPDREGWAARVEVPRAQVDLALERNGDTLGAAALLIAQGDGAVIRMLETRHHPQQGGLAATGGPQEGNELAVKNVQIQ